MVYVKSTKTASYFSRYQVKYRRRRQGKTDYTQRLTLVTQDKNKYSTPKYRLVVRFTNKDITVQIVYATLQGDIVISAAYAHELSRYGLKVGQTNYSAAYCVGLLIARRTLQKFNLDKTYTGVEEVTGEDYNVEEEDDGPRPFTCLLDVGLKRTTTGSKVFAVLKGALDGGLSIPHSEKRFVGYNTEEKSLNAETLRDHIFGGHVGKYMDAIEEEDADAYQKQFGRFIKEGVDSEGLEEMYKQVHSNIRADPAAQKKERRAPKEKKRWRDQKLTYEERKDRIRQKIEKLKEADGAEEEDDE